MINTSAVINGAKCSIEMEAMSLGDGEKTTEGVH